jgi:hypothetical protein
MTIILIFVLISNHNKNKNKSSEAVPDKNQRETEMEEAIVEIRELKPNYTFFDDSKSDNLQKQREGCSFRIHSSMSDGEWKLLLYKNDWCPKPSYMLSIDEDFVETIISVKGEDMIRLMQLCDNARNGNEAAVYLYKRFSPDGYSSYTNMINWFEENNIKTSFWSWP